MALICRLCIFKCPTGLISRVFNNGIFLQKCLKSSTSKIIEKTNDRPLKYTTNRAAKLDISETIGLKLEEDSTAKKISSFLLIFSTAIFLIYFCIIREENDIDDLLKGDPDGKIQLPELMKLKMDLHYCKKMNLPTDAIRARIEALEKEQEHKSPYLKLRLGKKSDGTVLTLRSPKEDKRKRSKERKEREESIQFFGPKNLIIKKSGRETGSNLRYLHPNGHSFEIKI